MELKGNEFKKSTRAKFIELFKEKKESLGVFESEDEEDEADELSKMFSCLVLWFINYFKKILNLNFKYK